MFKKHSESLEKIRMDGKISLENKFEHLQVIHTIPIQFSFVHLRSPFSKYKISLFQEVKCDSDHLAYVSSTNF